MVRINWSKDHWTTSTWRHYCQVCSLFQHQPQLVASVHREWVPSCRRPHWHGTLAHKPSPYNHDRNSYFHCLAGRLTHSLSHWCLTPVSLSRPIAFAQISKKPKNFSPMNSITLSDETKERISTLLDYSRTISHYGFIPFVLYLGWAASPAKPSLFSLLSPFPTL